MGTIAILQNIKASMQHVVLHFIILKNFIYFTETELLHTEQGKDRGRESPADSELSVELDAGLDLMTLISQNQESVA